MRIGEFSKKTSTSIDAIRHYITLGLLVPTKEGKYYKFDNRCETDLARIKEMKSMEFSLVEIKNVLLLTRFSKLTLGQERQHYRSFFRNKLRDLEEKKVEIDLKVEKLKIKIESIDAKFMQEPVLLGVDLNFLSKLYCPKCQIPLTLDNANIKDNMIIDGEMNCNCGYSLEIKEGIIINNESMKATEETDETYFIKYVDETNKNYLDNLYAAMAWCYKEIDFSSNLFLELGVGNGTFLSHIYNELPDDVVYVAVDYDFYKLRYIKKVFERSGIKKKIIFICADYSQIPIKHKTIDYSIDFFGMTNYSFKNNEVLHNIVNEYYKDNCTILGSYMLFDKFKPNQEILQEQYHLFKKDNILKYMKDLGFDKKEEYLIGYSEGGEKDDVVFDATDKAYIYGYLGKREK